MKYLAWLLVVCRLGWAAPLFVEFDLDSSLAPVYGTGDAKLERYSSQLATISYAVNSVSLSKNKFKITDQDLKKIKNGKIKLDVSGILEPWQVKYLHQNNPYDCSAEKSGPFRTDWPTKALFDANGGKGTLYLPILGIQSFTNNAAAALASFDTVEKKFGINPDLKAKDWKKLLFDSGESRITKGRRAVLFSKSRLGVPVWLTIDQDISALGPSINPFAVYSDDGNTSAGEIITQLPNGFPLYLLLVRDNQGDIRVGNYANNQLVTNNFATSSVWHASHFVSGQGKPANGISLASDCITCHRAGLVGPTVGVGLDKEALKKRLLGLADGVKPPPSAAARAEILREVQALDEGGFLEESEYEAGVEKNQKDLFDTLLSAGAIKMDPKDPSLPAPLIPDTRALYVKDLTLDNAATELRTTPSLLRKAKIDLGSPPSRNFLEQNFCQFRKLIGRLGPPPPTSATEANSRINANEPSNELTH